MRWRLLSRKLNEIHATELFTISRLLQRLLEPSALSNGARSFSELRIYVDRTAKLTCRGGAGSLNRVNTYVPPRSGAAAGSAISLSGAESHTTSHAGLQIELIPQPPVATRTSPVPPGEDRREDHITQRQEDQYTGNSVAEPPEEPLAPSEDGKEGEPE